MLKITSRNEKLNRRMARKEITRLFNKLFRCFFVSPTKSKNFPLFLELKKSKNHSLSKRQIFLSQFQRYFVNWQSKLSFRSSFTKARTICFLTGRSRSVYRAFRLSRLKIREYAAAGYFTGLSKASW